MQQGGLGQAGQCLVRALNDDIRPGSNGTALPAVGGGQWQIVRAVGFVHDQGNVGGVAQSGNGGKITQNTFIGGAGKDDRSGIRAGAQGIRYHGGGDAAVNAERRVHGGHQPVCR